MNEIIELKKHFGRAFAEGRILDVGTAEGTFMTALYKDGANEVLGIEPMEERAVIGQAKGLDIRTCKFESFDDETFDLVCFRESIYYINLGEVFSQLNKILRPGGGIYIVSHSADSIYYWMKGAPDRWGKAVKFKPTLNWLVTRLERRGYRIIEADYSETPLGDNPISDILKCYLVSIIYKLGGADRFYIIAERRI